MMTARMDGVLQLPPDDGRGPGTANDHRRWVELYGPIVAQQLQPDRRYSVVRVGSVEFAFVSYDAYVRALKQIWAAGFVPEPQPTVLGSELPDVAPCLQGVDVDLAGLTRADVEPLTRRFSS